MTDGAEEPARVPSLRIRILSEVPHARFIQHRFGTPHELPLNG